MSLIPKASVLGAAGFVPTPAECREAAQPATPSVEAKDHLPPRAESPEQVPSVRFDPVADNGLSHGELLRKDDYRKSGDSGGAF